MKPLVKETINRMKRQPPEWEMILVNDVTDKGSIFQNKKELTTQYIKKSN